MAAIPFIKRDDVEHRLTWTAISDAIAEGHRGPAAELGDLLLTNGPDSMLNRAAWIEGRGLGLKTANIFPGNTSREPPLPSIHSIVSLFDHRTGVPLALVDGDLVTKWKTAGDSILGARFLAREDSRTLTVVGAGVVARSMVDAYLELFPGLERILVWNRNKSRAQQLVSDLTPGNREILVSDDLDAALGEADIVTSATMSTAPLIHGASIRPGTHVDLIGAFRPDMREADDELVAKADIYVDSRHTALHDIGELGKPLADGVISESDVRGDFHDLCNGLPGRTDRDAVTLFKNGGGAHLDLMTAFYIRDMHARNS